MPSFFDSLVNVFDSGVGAAAMELEEPQQKRNRARIVKELDEISIISRVAYTGSIAIAAFGAAILLTATAAAAASTGLGLLLVGACLAVAAHDCGQVAENGNKMLTDPLEYGKTIRQNERQITKKLFEKNWAVDFFFTEREKISYTRSLIKV